MIRTRIPVTRLGYFLKVLATNFIAKVAQNFGYFVTILEYINFLLWTHLGNFRWKLGNFWGKVGNLRWQIYTKLIARALPLAYNRLEFCSFADLKRLKQFKLFLKLDHFFRPSFYWTKTGFEPTSEC